jgi:hypothetical protein
VVAGDLLHFFAFGGPLLRAPIGEGRQVKVVRLDKIVRLADDGVDFRSFHDFAPALNTPDLICNPRHIIN